MSKWKYRVSNPGAPLEVISSHLMDGKMRLREGSQPPGLRNELVAQSGLGLGRNMTATLGDFSLWELVIGWPLSPRTWATWALREKQTPSSCCLNEGRSLGPVWPSQNTLCRDSLGPLSKEKGTLAGPNRGPA